MKLPKYFSRNYRTPRRLYRIWRWRHQRIDNMVSEYDVWNLADNLLEILAIGVEQLQEGATFPIEYDEPEDWNRELQAQGRNIQAILSDWRGEYLENPEFPEFLTTFEEVDGGKYYKLVSANSVDEQLTQHRLRGESEARAAAAKKALYRFIRTNYHNLGD